MATDFRVITTFIRVSGSITGMLYEPYELNQNSSIGIVIMHTGVDMIDFPAGEKLARKGFRVLQANASLRGTPDLNQTIISLREAVMTMRAIIGIKKIILMGHSGGGNLIAAYQAIAENGAAALQEGSLVSAIGDSGKEYPRADGLVFLDPNYGNGFAALTSLDPAVCSENSGIRRNRALDVYAPENGYSDEGSHYPDEFVRRVQHEQSERMNRLIAYARERVKVIDSGEGNYTDDEPLVIPGGRGMQSNNKLYPQDVRLLSRTRGEHSLLRADGSVTTGIIHSVRKPQKAMDDPCSLNHAMVTTVKKFLSSSSIRTTGEFGFNEDSIYGVDWESTYSCAMSTITKISAPVLFMGMTGSFEFLASEMLYDRAASEDKTVVFVEGADHQLLPLTESEEYPGQFGDTLGTIFSYAANWITERYLK